MSLTTLFVQLHIQ